MCKLSYMYMYMCCTIIRVYMLYMYVEGVTERLHRLVCGDLLSSSKNYEQSTD